MIETVYIQREIRGGLVLHVACEVDVEQPSVHSAAELLPFEVSYAMTLALTQWTNRAQAVRDEINEVLAC